MKEYKNLYNKINQLKNNAKENLPNKNNNNNRINKINGKNNNISHLKRVIENNNKKLKKSKKRSKSLLIKTNNNSPPKKRNKKNTNIISQTSRKTITNKFKSKRKEEIKYDDYELNELPFLQSIKNDKRTFFQIYLSLLKTNHLLLFTFCNNNDYDSKAIKIYLFFFFFDSYIIINALFFNDKTLHKIYLEKGEYNFIYQLPKIIYSSLISGILNSLIKYISLAEKDIIEFKNKSSHEEEKEKTDLWKRIKFRFALFFIISYLFLLFFCYYISCFCAVYKNTQIQLIKNTLISWTLSLIYPIFLFIIPTTLRISSLRQKNECLYKLSQIIHSVI